MIVKVILLIKTICFVFKREYNVSQGIWIIS